MAVVEGTRPCWTITCDRCGEGDHEDGDHLHHATERQAREAIDCSDWRSAETGELLCMSCWEDGIPDEVACPRCGVEVGKSCRSESPWESYHPACDERIEAWAIKHREAAMNGETT